MTIFSTGRGMSPAHAVPPGFNDRQLSPCMVWQQTAPRVERRPQVHSRVPQKPVYLLEMEPRDVVAVG